MAQHQKQRLHSFTPVCAAFASHINIAAAAVFENCRRFSPCPLSGTLFSMASMLNHRIPGFVDEKTKAFPNQVRSLIAFTCYVL
jgi:hypothetical protein